MVARQKPEVKQCNCCKVKKPLREFDAYAQGRDGRHTACRLCRTKRATTHQVKVRRGEFQSDVDRNERKRNIAKYAAQVKRGDHITFPPRGVQP